MELKVNGRTIENLQGVIGLQNDSGLETIKFTLPRYYGETDLSRGLCYLLLKYPSGELGYVYLSKETAAETITATWLVGADATRETGVIQAQLKISGLENTLWHSEITRFTVARSLPVETPQPVQFRSARTAQPENESPITIAERRIVIPPELQNISVQNDENSETVAIVVPRWFDGHDLDGYSAVMKTISSGGRDDLLLEKVGKTESELRFSWTLRPPQTSYSGALQLQIRFEGEEFKWETEAASVNIITSLDDAPVIPTTPSILDDFVQQVAALAGQAAASKDAAAASQAAAKVSETNAKASETAAAGSAADAEASNQAAKTAQAGAEKSAAAALASQNAAKVSETNSKASETASKDSETKAKASETAAKGSQDAAKLSEDKAKASEEAAEAAKVAAETARDNAQAKAEAAEESAVKAKASEDAAKASETAAKASEDAAGKSAGQAANSATAAAGSATAAATSEANAAGSAGTANTKAGEADASAKLSKSYAVGGTGTRDGEDTDNARYYKEQTIISTAVAQDSAQTATEKATEAANSAESAARDAASIGEAAETATTKAEEAKASAENAKTEAEKAKAEADRAKDIVGGDYATRTELSTGLAGKVDTVAGKGLSTEDYSTAEKTKLAGVEEGATKYQHPATHPASMITGLGDAATKNVGTAGGTVAAGDHGHDGTYQPVGDYATHEALTEGLARKQDKGEFTREFAAKRNLPGQYGSSIYKNVVVDNGIFVATSYAGTVAAYSTDGGRTWTESALPTDKIWAGLAASNGIFVAVANDSDIAAFSVDGGKTWAQSTLPVSASWTSVAGDNGIFVAVAYNPDVVAYSTDGGRTWVQSTLPSTDGWAAVAGDRGTFVITSADTNAALYSTDGGQTWTKTALPNIDGSTSWALIAGSNGAFLTIQEASNITAYSDDGGKTWAQGSLPASIIGMAVYGSNGTFVVAAYNSNKFAYSTDGGRTWIEVDIPVVTHWYSVAFDSTDIVFVAYDATICCLDTIVSFEGNSLAGKDHLHPDYAYQLYVDSLTARNVGALPIYGGTLTGNLTLKKSGKNYGTKINFGDGDYVHLYEIEDDKLEIKAKNLDMLVSGTATYKGSEIATKEYVGRIDFGWVEGTLPVEGRWSVAEDGDIFVAVSSETTSTALYSTDGGKTWTQSVLPVSTSWKSVAGCAGVFVAVSGIGTTAAYSIDGGKTWLSSTLPVSGNWISVAGHNGIFVTVTYSNNAAAYSVDGGKTWIQSTLPAVAGWSGVAGNDVAFVAVSGATRSEPDSTITAYSTDCGKTWTQGSIPVGDWQSVTGHQKTFIASSLWGNKVARSDDSGKTWNAITSSSITNRSSFICVVFCNSLFIMVDISSNECFVSLDDGITWSKGTLPIANANSIAGNKNSVVVFPYTASNAFAYGDISCLMGDIAVATKYHEHEEYATKGYVDAKFTCGTTDLTAGTSALASGSVYLVYE